MKKIIFLLAIVILLYVSITSSYENVGGEFLVDCNDTPPYGEFINPSINEGQLVTGIGCSDAIDNNCNINNIGVPLTILEWDNNPKTGVDCNDTDCAKQTNQRSKFCCQTDQDCTDLVNIGSIKPGTCGIAKCNLTENTCYVKEPALADAQTKCLGLIQKYNWKCAESTYYHYPDKFCQKKPSGSYYDKYDCVFLGNPWKCTDPLIEDCDLECSGYNEAYPQNSYQCIEIVHYCGTCSYTYSECMEAVNDPLKWPFEIADCLSACHALAPIDCS